MESQPVAPLRTAFALTGLATLATQALLLRELMIAWRGNEMSLGIVLSIWLLTSAGGSAAYSLVGKRTGFSRTALARGLLLLGALSPVAVLVSRSAGGIMGLPAGELAGFPALVVGSLLSLAPFTLVAGFMFSLGVSVLSGERGTSGPAIGEVYIVEALGAAAGGVALSFWLLPVWSPVRISCLVTLVCAASAAFVLLRLPGAARRRAGGAVGTAVAVLLAAILGIAGGADRMDEATVRAQWSELGFVAHANSIYGRIVATEMGTQKSVYTSGVLAASAPDRLAAEEAVHLPTLQHDAPSSVLLLGGGMGGAVAEVLRHPGVKKLDYVDLDPKVIETAQRAFGGAMAEGLADPRVETHFADGRFYVKRATGSYDVVIINVPDPLTAQLNRFYTVEFMREVARILGPDGVVGTTVTSSENYVGTELAAFLGCLLATMDEVFPSVTATPGDPCHVMAAAGERTLTRDPAVLTRRIADRGLETVFVRDYYLSDRLSSERVESFDSALDSVAPVLNADLSPACYYLSLVLWNRQFAGAPGLLLRAPRYVNVRSAAIAAVVMVALLGAPLARTRRSNRPYARAVVAAVFVVGATEISLEITALLAFQSLYGYVYHELALLVAAFMAGLAAGGWAGARAVARGAGAGAFAAVQAGIALVPLGLKAVLAGVAGMPPESLVAAAALFPLIVVSSAVLAGVQFPIAASLYAAGASSGGASSAGARGGRLYAADLAGAALGATAASVFLLPIMGMASAMSALALMNVAVLVCLVIPLVRRRVR